MMKPLIIDTTVHGLVVIDHSAGDKESTAAEGVAETQKWVDAATKIFADFGFVLTNGWWKHEESGVYAAVDDARMGPGRVAAVYAHRIDSVGTDYMQGLVTMPWYGDGADIETCKRLLKNAIATVRG
jgi:hypothetical protein